MSKGMGWELPPGATYEQLDEAMGCETSAEEDERLRREEEEAAEARAEALREDLEFAAEPKPRAYDRAWVDRLLDAAEINRKQIALLDRAVRLFVEMGGESAEPELLRDLRAERARALARGNALVSAAVREMDP